MHIIAISRRRGNVVAFALMGVIALLAIVVVLFSRARRDTVPMGEPTTTHTTATGELMAAPEGVIADPNDLEATSTETPVQMPPPPPPIAPTPNPRDLPPEG